MGGDVRAVSTAVLMPVKAFGDAKQRLAAVLSPDERIRLARWLAERVLTTVDAPVYVACDDDGVRSWATGLGATVVWCPGLGLNGAVDAGIARIGADGHGHVIVTHSDLARPAALADVAVAGTITLVPDSRDDGTNVLSLPTTRPIPADYGGGSFRRHLAHAHAAASTRGGAVEVRRDPLLALDIDTPADLAHPLVHEVLPPWLPTNPANRSIPALR